MAYTKANVNFYTKRGSAVIANCVRPILYQYRHRCFIKPNKGNIKRIKLIQIGSFMNLEIILH